jgi:hypothetical protein
MTKGLVIAVGTVVALGGALVSSANAADQQDHKISICHVPPGNPENAHIITIDLHAWENGHTPHNAHDADFVVDADHLCPAVAETTTTVGEPPIQ